MQRVVSSETLELAVELACKDLKQEAFRPLGIVEAGTLGMDTDMIWQRCAELNNGG